MSSSTNLTETNHGMFDKASYLPAITGDIESNQYNHGDQHINKAPADTLSQMKAAKRWLVHRKKIPHYVSGTPRNGTLDSDSDIQNLATYELAKSVVSQYDGLGFALGKDGEGFWQGVDLDNVTANSLVDCADEIGGYVEKSPSGLGCHAIGYGREFATLGSNSTGIEAYAKARFFTVTENAIRHSPLICLADYVERKLAPTHSVLRDPTSNIQEVVVPPQVVTELRSALLHMRADNYALWISMGMALRELDDTGRGLWLEWSATSEKFDPKEATKKWETFKPDSTSYQAVFAEAQRQGWVNPNSNSARLCSEVSQEKLFTKTLSDFLKEQTQIEYLVDDVFRKGWLYTITGSTGAGKTGIAVTLALCIASGFPFGKYAVNSGIVLYIAGENPDDVRGRFQATLSQYAWGQAVYESIHVLDQSFILESKIEELKAIIDNVLPVAIIVDTDQAISLGDDTNECNNGARMRHAKNLRQLTKRSSRPTVIDLCHPNASASRDTLVPRGGSAFLNEIDGNVQCSRDDTLTTLNSDTNKFRGMPFMLSFHKRVVSLEHVTDTKGRKMELPVFEPLGDQQEIYIQVQQYEDKYKLLKIMFEKPELNQTQWGIELGYDKSKVSRLIKNLRETDPPLVNKNSTFLTRDGKKEAKKMS
ncbi:MAG: AAA family ATPase [Methylotenera sp.]|nr:AAA family ATPase [Methylotenera sp.]